MMLRLIPFRLINYRGRYEIFLLHKQSRLTGGLLALAPTFLDVVEGVALAIRGVGVRARAR